MEENGNHEIGDNAMTTEYEGNEDYIQKSYEATTTENLESEKSETEDISENREKPQEYTYISDSGSGYEEDRKENSTDKSYNVESQ
jgi:hypothetical protein